VLVAGPDIGDIYLETHADTKGLAAEVRRAASVAGRDFGKTFSKNAGVGLSGLGDQIRDTSGVKRAGKRAAEEFREALIDGVNRSSLDFDLNIAESINSGDWSSLFKNLDDVDAQTARIEQRLTTLGKQGGFSKLGVTAGDAKKQLAAYTAEAQRAAKASEEIRTKGVRAMSQYKDATGDTRDAMKNLSSEVRKLSKTKAGGQLGADLRKLSDDTKGLENEFVALGRRHRDSLTGMTRDSKSYASQLRTNAAEVKAFGARIADLSKTSKTIKTKVELDTPAPGAVAAEGAALGKIFSSAFNRSTSKGASGDSFFKPLQSEWNQFLYAFPAEVTLLLRYFALIGSELGSIGSGVGASLTALIGSLGSAIVGLGAAAASTFPAMVYSIGLAVASFKEFEKSFPATTAAISRLKAAFSDVDVPAFAAQWEGSVRKFANTLATSLETDKIATNLGKVAAQVTNAFTGVISSPAWTGFVGAMETTIPAALGAVGVGFANLSSAILPFLTAAAPLAQSLGEQFQAWSAGLSATANSAAGLTSMKNFLAEAGTSLSNVIDLVTGLGGALGATFSAGWASGNRMLQTLASLAQQWSDWSSSLMGQNALTAWFEQGEQIFNALIPLLGSVGQLFAQIVTPNTIAQTVNFMNQLSLMMPLIGQILGALSNLDLLGNIATLANSVLGALQPILPALSQIASTVGTAFGQLATSIGPVLTQAFSALAPVFNQLAGMIGPLIGALAPVFASLGTVVVQLATTIGQALGPVLAALGPVIQQLAPVFAQLAGTLGGVLVSAIQAFAPVLAQLLPVIAQLAATIGSALMPIIAALAPVFAQLAPVIGQIVTMLATTLAPIITALAPLIAQLVPIIGLLAQAFMPVVQTVLQVVAQLAGALMPVIQALIPIIMQLAPAIVQLFIAFNPVLRVITLLLPVVMPLIQLLAQLVTWILKLIAPLAPLINYVVTLIAQFIGFKGAIGAVGRFFSSVLIPAFTKVIGVFKSFGQGLSAAARFVAQFVSKGVALFGKFVTTVATKITGFISRFVSAFSGGFGRVVTAVGNFVSRVINAIARFVSNMSAKISSGINAVVRFFSGLPGKVVNAVTSLIGRMNSFWTGLFTKMGGAISRGISKVVGWFRDIPGKVVNALAGAGTLLLGVGEDIINGLWNGMKNIFGSITGWLGDKMASLPGPVKKVLGIHSPSKVFQELGRNIMQGLAVGILEDADDVVKAVTSVSKDVVAAQNKLVKEEADRIIEARKKQNDRIRASNKKNKNYLPTISRTEATKIATANTKALRTMVTKAYDTVIKEQSKRSKKISIGTLLTKADKGAGALNTYVKNQGATLRDLATARSTAATRLEAANKKLSDAIKVRDEFAASIRDAALQFASATSAAQTFGSKEFTASDVTSKMNEQLKKLKAFKANIDTLTKQGLNKTTLRQITEAGVEGGSQLASALVAGGKSAVNQTNTLQSKINTAAKGLGTSTSKTFYQAGVDSAKALAEGIGSQTKAITTAMNKLVTRLVNQVKKKLQIHSPSKLLMNEVGKPMGQGIVAGLERQRPVIDGLLSSIAATPAAASRANGTSSQSVAAVGRPNVTFAEGAIQVTPVVADPELVASTVLDRVVLALQ
jgi:phage-related protein